MFDLDPTLFPKKSLFPHLEEARLQVQPGEYKLLEGNDKPITFNERKFRKYMGGYNPDNEFSRIIPGVHAVGMYSEAGLDQTGEFTRLASFLYHKQDANGELEKVERVIIYTGTGYGEHPGHPGQPPSWYLVGPQIGTLDPETKELTYLPKEGEEVAAKNFSVACISGGPLGEPILANPPN
jgi:hypothetical protein